MTRGPALKGEPRAPRPTSRSLSDFIPRSLGTRLALTYTALALLIMAGLGWSLAWTIQNFFLSQLQSDLLRETMVVGDVMGPLLTGGADAEVLNAEADRLAESLDARVTVVDAAGTVLADSDWDAESMDNHQDRSEIVQAFREGTGSSFRLSSTVGIPYFYAARSIGDGTGVVRLALPVVAIDELVRGIRQQVFTAAVIAAVLMTGAGWFVAGRIKEALDDIGRQVAAIAAGRLDASVEPAATQELGDLGRAF